MTKRIRDNEEKKEGSKSKLNESKNRALIKKLLSESNLKNVFHAICGDKNLMSGEDIKKFIFHDAKLHLFFEITHYKSYKLITKRC